MKDWIEKLNGFLKFSEYEILTNAGKISHEVTEELALKEYEKYRVEQDKNYISDFDREVKKLLKKTTKSDKSNTFSRPLSKNPNSIPFAKVGGAPLSAPPSILSARPSASLYVFFAKTDRRMRAIFLFIVPLQRDRKTKSI